MEETEALREFKLWLVTPSVSRITYFGPFSLVPAFWEKLESDSYKAILEALQFEGKLPDVILIGPNENSIEELIKFLTLPAHSTKLEKMKTWSETARLNLSTGANPSKIAELVGEYKRHRDKIVSTPSEHGKKVEVKQASVPWEISAVTFAIAEDVHGNPVSAIFFGSPIPRDGLLPGEKGNLFNKPNIYSSRREEIGSLLISLEKSIEKFAVPTMSASAGA